MNKNFIFLCFFSFFLACSNDKISQKDIIKAVMVQEVVDIAVLEIKNSSISSITNLKLNNFITKYLNNKNINKLSFIDNDCFRVGTNSDDFVSFLFENCKFSIDDTEVLNEVRQICNSNVSEQIISGILTFKFGEQEPEVDISGIISTNGLVYINNCIINIQINSSDIETGVFCGIPTNLIDEELSLELIDKKYCKAAY